MVAPDKEVPEKTVPRQAAPEASPKAKATAKARALPPPAKTETITAVGQMVVLVQAELKKRGYDPGELNGRAGEQTRQAVRAFKRKEGLAVNDTIDDELFEKLGIVGRRIHPFASSSK
ncbi:MAG: peptidoglycan-binding protein [Alphaproteobacteria bacterium]